jgi:hypothetical protein
LLAVLDAAALHLSLNPESAPAEIRPFLRVGYSTVRSIAGTLGIGVSDDPHPDDPMVLTREDFNEALVRAPGTARSGVHAEAARAPGTQRPG